MDFSDIIENLAINHIWNYFLFLHWQKLPVQSLATLLIVFFWYVNYANLVFKLFITLWKCQDTQSLFILEGILVLTYKERFFSAVCCFFSYICWSVSCKSWVSKFNDFFLTCTGTEERFIFEDFNIVLYGKFISNSRIIFSLFCLVCKLFKGLFQPHCQSGNCTSWVFES